MSKTGPYNPFEHNQVLWILLGIFLLVFIFAIPLLFIFVVIAAAGWFIFRQKQVADYSKSIGFIGNQEDEILSVLALAAYLSKADRKVSKTEMNYMRENLATSFDQMKADAYMETFEKFLRSDISLSKVAHKINLSFVASGKIQLLHFLIGLITVDHILNEDEEKKLYAIARALRVPKSSIQSLLALFRFRREQKRYKKQQKAANPGTRTSVLKNAYAIFGLKSTASDTEIKKKYRQLAKKHHPDRFATLGTVFQEKAKEKFQTIQEAYEVIKKHKGFN